MLFEEDLKREQEDRKKSLDFYFSKDNNIQKSISHEIEYSTPELTSTLKKGKDIKDKLIHEKDLIVQKMAITASRLTFLAEKTKDEPRNLCEGEESSYPKFDYSQIYSSNGNGQNESPLAKEMREFNNLSYKMFSYKDEMKRLSAIISNINENKEYKLPLNVSIQLGF